MKRRRPILLAVGAVVVALPATAVAEVPRPAAATPAWQRDATPTAGPTSSYDLTAVAVTAPSEAWASGTRYTEGQLKSRAVMEHWSGSTWSVVDTAAVDISHRTSLNALSASGPGDVWAVGSDYPPTGKGRSLIEHWNGASWIRSAPVPDEAANDSLNAVSTDGSNDVWAVGSTFSPSAGYQPLVEHFDGTTWAAQSFASPSNQFTAVEALSPDDVWVLGNVPGYGSSGLIEHFDGKGWKAVAQPASVFGVQLNAISAVSPRDIWVVGQQRLSTLVEHWNGRLWQVVPSPNGSPGPFSQSTLTGVTALAANDIWASGSFDLYPRSLVEHWDGSTWKVSPTPKLPPQDTGLSETLNSIGGIDNGPVFAVGTPINGAASGGAATILQH